jgi:succinate-acetate transporter protein
MADHSRQGGVAADPDGDGLRRRDHTVPQEAAREQLAARLERLARINLRPIASPVPMGFVGLAAGTLTLATLNLGWIPRAEGMNVALVLIAFVVPLQLMASIFGSLARDGVVATAMGILAGTWLTVGLVMATSPPGSTSDALGVLLLVSGVAMLWPALGAWLSKLVPATVLTLAALRFASSGVYQLTASTTWATITGWIGIALGAVALYAALAALLENVSKKTVLPMGRRHRARQAVEGGLTDQMVDLTHEPGVRNQL